MKKRPAAEKHLPSWVKRSKRTGGASGLTDGELQQLPGRPALVRSWNSTADLRNKVAAALLPEWWIRLVMEAALIAQTQSVLALVEFFAGLAALTRAVEEFVGPSIAYDNKYGVKYDLLTDIGLKFALTLLLRLSQNGHSHYGTPCQSWVALSRSWSQRSPFLPSGPPRNQCSHRLWRYLEKHNRLAELTALLIRTGKAIGASFTLEQPVSSLIFAFDPMVRALVGSEHISFEMGSFQGESPKPLRLQGNVEWLQTFRAVSKARKKTSAKPTSRLASSDARGGFTGRKKELESSSAYTQAFGRAFALCMLGCSAPDVVARLAALGH